MNLNKKYKFFFPLDKQIEKLKEKDLLFENESYAKHILIKNSYYNLINGYKDAFLSSELKKKNIEKFEDGTTFNDIYKLYEFDSDLRQLILNITLSFEEDLASSMAYVISEEYGDDHNNFLNYKKLRTGDSFYDKKRKKRTNERKDFLERIDNILNNPNEHPLKHYKENYINIPAWILVKSMTFGNLKMWYKLSESAVKNKIISIFLVKDIDKITDRNKEIFMKSLDILNQFRNKAAHGGRLYNYKGKIILPYIKEYHLDIFGIEESEYNTGKGKSDFLAFLISLFYLYDGGVREYMMFDFAFIKCIRNLQKLFESFIEENENSYKKVFVLMNIESNYVNLLIKNRILEDDYLYKYLIVSSLDK